MVNKKQEFVGLGQQSFGLFVCLPFEVQVVELHTDLVLSIAGSYRYLVNDVLDLLLPAG